MKTIRRLIHREVLTSIAYVALGFLGLFGFFDMVDELQAVGRHAAQGYTLPLAVAYVLLLVPSHLYELMPIVVLIGTIFVMARLAQGSEYTILRTSGLGPSRALATLLTLGAFFAAFTFVLGDYAAPWSDRTAQLLKSRFSGTLTTGQTGAWLRERQTDQSFAVNVGGINPDGTLSRVRIFTFDAQGRIAAQTVAPQARFDSEGAAWLLQDAHVTRLPPPGLQGADDAAAESRPPQTGRPQIERSQPSVLRWPTEITSEMVSTALLKPERMATLDLFQYVRHLSANNQATQRYEIEFWKKVFYPLGCLVMVVLALPFAYLHFRDTGITTYVFIGVMIGISFFLANNLLGHVGNLRDWQPLLTAAAPGLVYSLASLAAFAWLVVRH